jgi:hypothetical protein
MRHLSSIAVSAAFLVIACGSDDASSSGATSGGTASGQRPVTAFNGVSYGATCGSDAECGGAVDSCCTGGKCSAQGWCSPSCKDDKSCPAGFFCIDHSGTRCFYGCTDDRDCPTGFICEDKSDHKTCRFK